MALGKGLGRGLDALFGEAAAEEQIKGIKITDIEPRPDQPRQDFDPDALEALAESIRENGLITPITVRKTGETYQIIAGERRWRAARMAGLAEIPALVLEADDVKSFEMALVENLQRQDLNPIEEAEGYRTLVERLGLTHDEAAKKVGIDRSSLTNVLRRLSLPERIKESMIKKEITAGHGKALLALPDEKTMLQAFDKVIKQQLSVRETEKLVAGMKKGPKEKKVDVNAIYIEVLQREMSESTGHKVLITHGAKKGKLTIEYYGNEDLEKVCEALKNIK